ncbi:hypothetical protein LP419_11175 [Massilia sp. H-1]|nr:hypothetical protein LP419_11175 [Massilia sp. H-1]
MQRCDILLMIIHSLLDARLVRAAGGAACQRCRQPRDFPDRAHFIVQFLLQDADPVQVAPGLFMRSPESAHRAHPTPVLRRR